MSEIPPLPPISTNPLVSVIINNFNYARFVGCAIQSALDQTYQNIEVIVVDDGSTDGSRSVIEGFGPRIASIFKPNGGQGSAYNVGFERSRGELILFLDSDDLLDPAAVETVVSAWESGVAKVHFYLRVVKGDKAEPTGADVPTDRLSAGNLRGLMLASGNYISPPSSGNVYARQALIRILPMPEAMWVTAADLYCIFQSAFFGTVKAIEQPLGSYRVHGSNMDAQNEITGSLLRYRMTLDTRREYLLDQFCRAHSIPYKSGTALEDIAHLKLRIASLLVEPSKHPFPEDRVIPLLAKSLRACLSKATLTPKKKGIFCCWLVSMVFSPRVVRRAILSLAFNPAARPQIMQRAVAHAKQTV
jgi:glycosyltransferase involved in cell wall biosynthesis